MKESDRGSPKEHFYTKLFENRLNTFGGEYFLSFHYSYKIQNSPAPWRPCFSTNQHVLKGSNKGSPKEHFYTKLFENRPDTFGEEDFLSFHYFFLLDQKYLKEFKRGH